MAGITRHETKSQKNNQAYRDRIIGTFTIREIAVGARAILGVLQLLF